MKNITKLQALMFAIIAGGSYQMYANMDEDQAQAVRAELQAEAATQSTQSVLQDLAVMAPAVVEQIIEDESDLDATFNRIKQFVGKKNKEIEKLQKEKNMAEEDIARLAVELADAQAMFDKYVARQRDRHKHNHKHEQAIQDMLTKANRGLQSMQEQFLAAMNYLNSTQAAQYAKAGARNAYRQAKRGAQYASQKAFGKKQNKKANNAVANTALDNLMANIAPNNLMNDSYGAPRKTSGRPNPMLISARPQIQTEADWSSDMFQ